MINASIVLAGQLLGTAFACGLNLYATLAVLGIASRLGWVAELPPGMRGLENGVVIGLALALYVIEFIVDRVRYVDHAWEAVHTLIRPAAAALLTALAMQDAPWYIRIPAAAAAGAMALAAHGSKAGLRLILATRHARKPVHERPRRGLVRTALSLSEDLAAAGLALAVVLIPTSSIVIVIVSTALLLFGGPILWRAAFLGARAVIARAHGFFGSREWRTRSQLGSSLGALVPVEPLGRSPLRAAPAAIAGLPRIGAYRNGWLVFTCDGPRFLYRSLFRPRCIELPTVSDVRIRNGLVTDVLDVRANGAGQPRIFTIYLMKDGPMAHITAAELHTPAPDSEHVS